VSVSASFRGKADVVLMEGESWMVLRTCHLEDTELPELPAAGGPTLTHRIWLPSCNAMRRIGHRQGPSLLLCAKTNPAHPAEVTMGSPSVEGQCTRLLAGLSITCLLPPLPNNPIARRSQRAKGVGAQLADVWKGTSDRLRDGRALLCQTRPNFCDARKG
jgi:hypothetical protein